MLLIDAKIVLILAKRRQLTREMEPGCESGGDVLMLVHERCMAVCILPYRPVAPSEHDFVGNLLYVKASAGIK